jgi:photosystem II stability/assembly factor-like uncharacterized protein
MKATKCYRRDLSVGKQITAFLALTMSLGVAAQSSSLSYQGIGHDSFYDICFQGETGLAVGDHSVVLQSQDSGNSWQRLAVSDDSFAMLGVACLDSQSVIVGQEGRISIGQNGDWRSVDSGTEERLLSVSLTESGLGFAVGGFGTVLRTKDGGETWNAMVIDWEAVLQDFLEPHIYDVAISETGTITIVGEFGLVLQSQDNGENWTSVRRAEASLFAIQFSDVNHGYAVGQDGEVIRTGDGGKSWQSVDTGSSGNLLDVWSSQHGEVLITGIRTMLRSSDDGLSWTRVVSEDMATSWYQGVAQATSIHQQEQNTAIVENVFAVGNSGKIIKILE